MFMLEAPPQGICIFGDGATIKKVHQVNIFSLTPSNPGCVLDVVGCTKHHKIGGKKDPAFLAQKMPPLMKKLDPKKKPITLIAFNGASNFQKADHIPTHQFPKVMVIHRVEHVV